MKIIKLFLPPIMLLLLISCSGLFSKNRFSKSENLFYFGEYSGDFDKECRDYKNPNPKFFGLGLTYYSNGVKASKACTNYQEYLCRINITCKKYPTEQERKKCEFEAGAYWLPDWVNANNNLEKRAEISRKVCRAQAAKCSSSSKDDYSCLNSGF